MIVILIVLFVLLVIYGNKLEKKALDSDRIFIEFDDSIHEDPEQQARIKTALEQDLKAKTILSSGFSGKIIDRSGKTYTTSLKQCNCQDFKNRKKPCKHMYFLAIQTSRCNISDNNGIIELERLDKKESSNTTGNNKRSSTMSLFDIFSAGKIKQENQNLKAENERLQGLINTLGVNEYCETVEKIKSIEEEHKKRLEEAAKEIDAIERERSQKIKNLNSEVSSSNNLIAQLQNSITELQERNEKLNKNIATQTRKLSKCKELYKSVDHAITNFFESDAPFSNCKITPQEESELDLISPTVTLKLHCMDIKSLRSAYKDNEKQINQLLEQYSARYTTKANKAIYNLMVIALRAELQNILSNLKYEKLEKSIEDVKTVSAKYLSIAGDGNQNIATTLTKFIGEIEYLFINAVKIEYNYYVKREQAKQEQLAIREQMRQEAEERKALEAQKKKVEQEETKYKTEIAKLEKTISSASSNDEIAKLQARILELQGQLSDVVLKKEEISNLQNGKAGNVYIISNLGSFGNDVFKIGMTRRLDPQERINELGSASVPFKFDVHSFIFSEDAVALENKLHNLLNDKRVNKVNLRKEFFKIDINELEALVSEIEPAAEFNKTMLAEEFNQSLSSSEVYSNEYTLDNEDDD